VTQLARVLVHHARKRRWFPLPFSDWWRTADRGRAHPTLALVAHPASRRQRSGMATHEVNLRLNQRITIENVDAIFPVWSDDEFLGRLRVSKGGVDWIPARGKTAYGLRWERLADMMVEYGRRKPVRS
jgi:hypothetical protein